MKGIVILGSTGSIGRSAISVIESHPNQLKVVGLAAGQNAKLLSEQVSRLCPRFVTMMSEDAENELRTHLDSCGVDPLPKFGIGHKGLIEIVTQDDVDVVLCASAGTSALEAVLAAIERGKTIALANKEVLVMAGALVMAASKRFGVPILPVDSEHNAIHQCLHGRRPDEVKRLILTASGGPFYGIEDVDLSKVTREDALKHPTWKMGDKITIDSATLMNKGLEVIEARWLFDIPPERIDVIIHPQSVIHSMVELRDGSVLAQLGVADMRLPIQYALSYPMRWDSPVAPLDFVRSGPLEFDVPDRSRFPCLDLAYRALRGDGGLTAVLNAANEVAVATFLEGKISFTTIPSLIEQTMDAYKLERSMPVQALKDVRNIDRWARKHVDSLISELGFQKPRFVT